MKEPGNEEKTIKLVEERGSIYLCSIWKYEPYSIVHESLLAFIFGDRFVQIRRRCIQPCKNLRSSFSVSYYLGQNQSKLLKSEILYPNYSIQINARSLIFYIWELIKFVCMTYSSFQPHWAPKAENPLSLLAYHNVHACDQNRVAIYILNFL